MNIMFIFFYMLFNIMVNIMRVFLTHQTFGVGNKINVNMIRVWHKMIKLWVDNNEGVAYTLNPWY
jgi:Na+-translocating ferredoxin:NAD+ oxidoreductase RnfG subunit